MGLIRKARSIQRRLAGAVHRHGLIHVATVVGLTMMRQGLFSAFRMAGSGRPFPQKPSKRLRMQAPPPPMPPDLDAGYTLSATEWRAWSPILAAAPASADPQDDRPPPAAVEVVILDEAGAEPGALDDRGTERASRLDRWARAAAAGAVPDQAADRAGRGRPGLHPPAVDPGRAAGLRLRDPPLLPPPLTPGPLALTRPRVHAVRRRPRTCFTVLRRRSRG